jgi:hypothetical protein
MPGEQGAAHQDQDGGANPQRAPGVSVKVHGASPYQQQLDLHQVSFDFG